MIGKQTNENILRDANVRLCRLRMWKNYPGFGFHLDKCTPPPHLICLVESSSPAAAGGLEIYDVVLAINSTDVSKMDYSQVEEILNDAQKHDQWLELLVVGRSSHRDLKEKNITIDYSLATIHTTPESIPKDYVRFRNIRRICHLDKQSNGKEVGFQIIGRDAGTGAFIKEVILDSPAYEAGLRKSDQILAINDIYVEQQPTPVIVEKLKKAFARGTVKLLVVDTGKHRNPMLDKPGVNQDDSYIADQVVSNERVVMSVSPRSPRNNEVSASNESLVSPYGYEYISSDDDGQSNKTTVSSTRNASNKKEYHSSNHSLDQNGYLPLTPQSRFNSKHNNTHMQSNDIQKSNTPHFHPNSSFCNRDEISTTARNKPYRVKQKDNSAYLELSSIVPQVDDVGLTVRENAMNDDRSDKANQRFFDTHNQSLIMMLLIEGYENTPLMPLTTAIESLDKFLPEIQQNARIALGRSSEPADGLTADESASIQLYTMKWNERYEPLSMQINAALRAEDRCLLRDYFPYLKLILTALWKLESVHADVWRGVRSDVRLQYPIGKTFVSWEFSSCMISPDRLRSDKYLGDQGIQTLFKIECTTGKSIRAHSHDTNENEILLLPATQFQVINHGQLTNNAYVIYLKEILPRYTPLQPSFTVDYLTRLSINNTNNHRFQETRNPSFHNQYFQEFIRIQRKNTSLCIHKQSMTINDMYLIAREIRSNQYWCKISLRGIRFSDESMTMILLDALESNSIITVLDLSSNEFNDSTSLLLARALKTNTSLKTIDLTDNEMTDIGALAFCDMLKTNKTLLKLNLSSNRIGNHEILSIVFALQHSDTLNTLSLNGTKRTDSSHGEEMFWDVQSSMNLKALYLNENNLGDHNTISISHLFIGNERLNTLHLTMNNLTYASAEKIASLLQETNSCLTELNISRNPLQDMGVISIAQAVSANTTLTELYLDSVEMTMNGLHEVMKMIRTNDTLKHLSLKKNDINDDGMVLLLNGMQCNDALTHLYLDMNRLTDKCIPDIIHALESNNTLRYLYLSDNQFTGQGKLTLHAPTEVPRTQCIC